MFGLRRLLQIGRSTRNPAPIGNALPPDDPIKLVAITQNSDDEQTLRQIADGCGWTVSIVGTSAAAISLLKEQPTPLVICDSELSGEDWREALAGLAALPQSVCVLLASPVADEYLWNEVIKHHGYDVVAKPFRLEELRSAVTFAWSWRGWTSRYYKEAPRKPSS